MDSWDDDDLGKLKYGVSVTDECIGWEETEELLEWAYDKAGDIVSTAKNC